MRLEPRAVVGHIFLFIVILVVLTAVAIWLDLGPVLHSSSS
jgi:hypothetical protein